MKPTSFAALAVVTVLALVVAIATYAAQNRWSQAKVSGASLFPGLAAQAARIAKIELKQGDKTLTLARDKDAWSLADRGGYPAKAEAVRALLVKLAQAELVESKTQQQGPLRPARAGGPRGQGRQVAPACGSLDDKGAPIAEAIVGKKRFDAFGASKSGTYVRKPGDAQTWLSNADLDVSAGRARLGAAGRARPRRGQDRQGDDRDPRRGAAGDRARRRRMPASTRSSASPTARSSRKAPASTPSCARPARSTWKMCASRGAGRAGRRGGRRQDRGRRRARRHPAAAQGGRGPLALARGHRRDGDAKKTADEIAAKAQGWEFKIPAAQGPVDPEAPRRPVRGELIAVLARSGIASRCLFHSGSDGRSSPHDCTSVR